MKYSTHILQDLQFPCFIVPMIAYDLIIEVVLLGGIHALDSSNIDF